MNRAAIFMGMSSKRMIASSLRRERAMCKDDIEPAAVLSGRRRYTIALMMSERPQEAMPQGTMVASVLASAALWRVLLAGALSVALWLGVWWALHA